MTRKNPLVAALLSFLLLGAGQIYNKQIGRAIWFWFWAGVGIFFIAVGIHNWHVSTGVVGVIFGSLWVFVVYLFAIHDAFVSARQINERMDDTN